MEVTRPELSYFRRQAQVFPSALLDQESAQIPLVAAP